MTAVEESIDVHADTQRVYEMWTQFEYYPDFMPGIREVRRKGETLMDWVADYGGTSHRWEAQVVQMDPELRIVFQTTHEPISVRTIITFHPSELGTRITFRLENDPGPQSSVTSLVQESLRNFKAIAEQGPPTRWPGTLNRGVEAVAP